MCLRVRVCVCVCVRVCVCVCAHPQTIKNYSHENEAQKVKTFTAFLFLYMAHAIDSLNECGLNKEARCELQPGNAVLVVHLTVKGILPVIHY